MATPDEIDAAIGAGLLDGGSDESVLAIADLGPRALARWIEIYHGTGRRFARPAGVRLHGREEVDVWSSMLYALATTHQSEFLEAVEGGLFGQPLTTPVIVCLVGIGDARAVPPLVQAMSSPDWLCRYHALRGLALRVESAARTAVERALEDPEDIVRVEAVRAIARHDQERARELYLDLLSHHTLSPMLRTEILAEMGHVDDAGR